jgi:TRAP-type C4-dicarboxylate transport system substrate-binding protein
MNLGRIRVAILVAVALLLGGCTSAPVDKSGGDATPRTLVLASNDGEGLEGVAGVAHFVQTLSTLSEGRLVAEVHPSWTGDDYDEPRLVRDIADGRADLGWVGTRALDLAGDPSFRPLHAPFLVGTYSAQAAVLSDTALVRDLLGSLEPLGVTGLAVLGDEMRIPFGVTRALSSVKDFRGATFATFPSGIQTDGIAALGGTPVSPVDQKAIVGGLIDGFEATWWSYSVHDYALAAPYATTNAGLWPRTVALFANPASLGSLSEEERGWLDGAAQEATTWSVQHARDAVDAEILGVCRAGGRMVLATEADLDALRQQAEPVYAAMRSDPVQGAILERVEKLAAAAPPDPPLSLPFGCELEPGEKAARTPIEEPLAGPGRMGGLPPGTYRADISAAWLRARGGDEEFVRNNAGVYTTTVRGGHWSTHQMPELDSEQALDCQGWLDVRGDVVHFTTTTTLVAQDCSPPTWTAHFALRGKDVVWSDVNAPADPDYGMYPTWTRVE